MAISAQKLEKQFNELLLRYIYATFDDIREKWEGDTRYTPLIFQNYENLKLDKATRKSGLKAVFTISSETKQIFTKMFELMIEEIRNVQLDENDTAVTIREKLIEANTECMSAFMFKVGTDTAPYFGQVLKTAGDVEQYFQNRILGLLPEYKTKPVTIALLSQEFDRFLKGISWTMAKQLWYDAFTVNDKYTLGLLASKNLEQIQLDVLQSSIRVLEKKAPKAKTGTTPTSTESSGATTPTLTTAVAETITTTPSVDDVTALINSI
jgi:hypothetical protein